jgi:hypothetical protein
MAAQVSGSPAVNRPMRGRRKRDLGIADERSPDHGQGERVRCLDASRSFPDPVRTCSTLFIHNQPTQPPIPSLKGPAGAFCFRATGHPNVTPRRHNFGAVSDFAEYRFCRNTSNLRINLSLIFVSADRYASTHAQMAAQSLRTSL